MAEVRLVDLELIKRYSLAVRRDTVEAEELLGALDASRATVLAAMGRSADVARPSRKRQPRAAPPAQPKPNSKVAPAAGRVEPTAEAKAGTGTRAPTGRARRASGG